jgi:uncharacterized protein DUF6624
MGRWAVVLVFVVLTVVGCGGSDSHPESEPQASSSEPVEFDQELHDELMAMFRRDQAGRTGGVDNEGDEARTYRLQEIIDEYGWPTFDLVGKKGANAAWIIAQHSDLYPQFQAKALKLIRAAAEDGQASWGNVAYLQDRVAVGRGNKQTYGTQIRCVKGRARLATPLVDPDGVGQLRADAGLESLDDYFDEVDKLCASEGS